MILIFFIIFTSFLVLPQPIPLKSNELISWEFSQIIPITSTVEKSIVIRVPETNITLISLSTSICVLALYPAQRIAVINENIIRIDSFALIKSTDFILVAGEFSDNKAGTLQVRLYDWRIRKLRQFSYVLSFVADEILDVSGRDTVLIYNKFNTILLKIDYSAKTLIQLPFSHIGGSERCIVLDEAGKIACSYQNTLKVCIINSSKDCVTHNLLNLIKHFIYIASSDLFVLIDNEGSMFSYDFNYKIQINSFSLNTDYTLKEIANTNKFYATSQGVISLWRLGESNELNRLKTLVTDETLNFYPLKIIPLDKSLFLVLDKRGLAIFNSSMNYTNSKFNWIFKLIYVKQLFTNGVDAYLLGKTDIYNEKSKWEIVNTQSNSFEISLSTNDLPYISLRPSNGGIYHLISLDANSKQTIVLWDLLENKSVYSKLFKFDIRSYSYIYGFLCLLDQSSKLYLYDVENEVFKKENLPNLIDLATEQIFKFVLELFKGVNMLAIVTGRFVRLMNLEDLTAKEYWFKNELTTDSNVELTFDFASNFLLVLYDQNIIRLNLANLKLLSNDKLELFAYSQFLNGFLYTVSPEGLASKYVYDTISEYNSELVDIVRIKSAKPFTNMADYFVLNETLFLAFGDGMMLFKFLSDCAINQEVLPGSYCLPKCKDSERLVSELQICTASCSDLYQELALEDHEKDLESIYFGKKICTYNCPKNCDKCYSENSCLKCKSGFYLDQNFTSDKLENELCVSCPKVPAVVANDGFGKCTNCTWKIEYCQECNLMTCLNCNPGLELKDTKDYCDIPSKKLLVIIVSILSILIFILICIFCVWIYFRKKKVMLTIGVEGKFDKKKGNNVTTNNTLCVDKNDKSNFQKGYSGYQNPDSEAFNTLLTKGLIKNNRSNSEDESLRNSNNNLENFQNLTFMYLTHDDIYEKLRNTYKSLFLFDKNLMEKALKSKQHRSPEINTDVFTINYNEEPYVVKWIESFSSSNLRRFLIEALATAQISCEYVIKLYWLYQKPGEKGVFQYSLVMAYYDYDLEELIQNPQKFKLTLQQKVFMFTRLVSGLQLFENFCEDKYIIHADIKPENILVSLALDNNSSFYLPYYSDFTLSHVLSKEVKETKVASYTVNYASPEQIKYGTVSSSSDLYSVGLIMMELIIGFVEVSDKKAIKNDEDSFNSTWEKIVAQEVNKNSVMVLMNLIRSILNISPKSRPSAKEVLDNLSMIERNGFE